MTASMSKMLLRRSAKAAACGQRRSTGSSSHDQLHERHVDLSDPVPTGRQILQAAGSRPADEYSIYAILTSGEFEDLRLDETYDLRGRGAERFVIFQTDRAFKFTIDDRQLEWGKPSISGRVLKALAGVPPETYDVYLEVRGG